MANQEKDGCLLCRSQDAAHQFVGETGWVYRCPACGVYRTDHLFERIARKESVPDAHLLSGYARHQHDAGAEPPTFTYDEHIWEASRRTPAHTEIASLAPQTIREKVIRILNEVADRTHEYGEVIELDPRKEFPICFAKSPREFHELVRKCVDDDYLTNRGNMHVELVTLTEHGEDALRQWHQESEPRMSIDDATMATAKKIFIGHGRSAIWKDLRDFLEHRLKLDWDEFNREPPAGLVTAERLTAMLQAASFAFIVLTGEDEHADGTRHARANAIHEAGLFQGRLGFRRAIILLEEGCEEFSNIVGLTQIRFPKGDIMAKSEEIRRVLEREGLLDGP